MDTQSTINTQLNFQRYTPEHEVLTERGWIFLEHLTIGDKVATLDTNNNLKYENLSESSEYSYVGEICQIESNQISLSLTPSNNVYIGNYKGTDYKSKSIKEACSSTCKYLKSCSGVLPDYSRIKEFKTENRAGIDVLISFHTLPINEDEDEIVVPIDLWVFICSIILYSLVLTGSEIEETVDVVTKNPIIISKLSILTKAGLAIKEDEERENGDKITRFIINHSTLIRYLNEIKGIGISKFPKWLLHLPKKQARQLLQFLIKQEDEENEGNGTFIKEYIVENKEIADIIQILCLYAGYSANIHKIREDSNAEDSNAEDSWRIEIIMKKFDKAKVDVVHNKIIKYKGKIYQISTETKEPRFIYLRKNGKGCWT